MTATYDPTTIATDEKNFVRLMIGDTFFGTATPPALEAASVDLTDEEITAILAEESNKYLAAARCGEIILAKSQGVVSKNVDNLGLSVSDSPTGAFRAHLQRLREDGANRLTAKKNRVFRVV